MHLDPTSSAGPLAGVRVLELGNFIAGPFAGQLLGDYGADVIKIEAPDGGDPMRTWGITHEGHGLWWAAIARNKRSVVADLRTEDGRQLVQAIARSCDVILENFRPGRLVEFGLDYETVSRTNPGVIVVPVGLAIGLPAGYFRPDLARTKPDSDRSAKRSAAFATPPATPTAHPPAAASAWAIRSPRSSR